MKKIFYINNSRIPTEKAHGFSISKMCEQFSELEHEVKLVLPDRKNKINKNLFDFYEIKKSFEVKYINIFDFFALDWFPKKLAYYLNSLQFHIRALFRYLLDVKKEEVIVYTRGQITAFLFSIFSDVFWEANDYYPKRKKGLYQEMISKLKGLVVVTENLKERYEKKFNLDNSQTLVARNAIELEKINSITKPKKQLKKELDLPKDKKVIGYLGKFHIKGKEKGVKFLVETMKVIKKDYPEINKEIKLCCVGGEKDRLKKIRFISQDLGLEDEIKLVGRVQHSKALKFIKAFDILTMPFPKTFEYSYCRSPIKMFEYMATKNPIIASHLPAIGEVLTHEENGMLYKPEDKEDFIKNLKQLIINEGLVQQISKRAYKDVQKYTWKRRAKKIIDFIDNEQ